MTKKLMMLAAALAVAYGAWAAAARTDGRNMKDPEEEGPGMKRVPRHEKLLFAPRIH